ncbi:alpha/beta hydrolase [Chitinophaga sp.]|uniref:alpha/beta hydrolase n=1 Tax=Chitinophaga sp. TaxID=1869181 RepID=UPI0031E41D75
MLPACKHESASQAVPVDTSLAVGPGAKQELILLNQHYGDDSLQTIDIYLPAGRSPKRTHLMVFVHGGGWMGGDKSDFTTACEGFVRNTTFSPAFAYVNVNYRLVRDGKNQFPAAEEDLVAAMNYMYAHADSFQVSPLSALIGASAGAQLTTLIAYKHNEKKNIKCVVSNWGPYDLTRMYNEGSSGVPELMNIVLGATPSENPEIYEVSSPVTYVSPDSPPTFLVHGKQDTLVRIDQGMELDSVLSKNKVEHFFYTFDGYHGYSSDQVANDAADKMYNFIAKYTK